MFYGCWRDLSHPGSPLILFINMVSKAVLQTSVRRELLPQVRQDLTASCRLPLSLTFDHTLSGPKSSLPFLCEFCFVLFCFYFLPVWFWQAVRSFYSGFCAHIISSITCWFLWVTLSPSFENNLPSLQMYWPFRKTTAALIHSCLCFSLCVSLSEIHPNNVPWEPVSVPGTGLKVCGYDGEQICFCSHGA